MTTSAPVLFIPRNPGEKTVHGGVRREAQVWGLIVASGIKVDRVEGFPLAPASRLRRTIDGVRFSLKQSRSLPLTYGSLQKSAITSAVMDAYRRYFADHPDTRVVVLENTRDHLALIDIALEAGLKVLSVPHDLEALSTGKCRHNQSIDKLATFHHEMTALGRSSSVFCISFEEQWFLRAFGIDADLLPYFPASQFCTGFEKTRDNRRSTIKDHFFIVGSALHAPTREGMVELIEWLGAWPDRAKFRFTIAGFGSESLAAQLPSDGFRLMGSVSDEELSSLMTTARAVLVHQRSGCGALTRIPELLYAGLPVIANTIGARTYHGYPGVHLYSYPEELYALLAADLPESPMPPRPRAAEKKMIDLITSWVTKSERS